MRLIFDMDNTLADFDGSGGLKNMEKEGFFKNLDIYVNVAKNLHMLSKSGFDLYILSACINTKYCKTEKLEWVANNLPFISINNVILLNVGQNKADEFQKINKTKVMRTDVLFDDYGKNLKDWDEAGGTAVKCGRVRKIRPYLQLIKFENMQEVLKNVINIQ